VRPPRGRPGVCVSGAVAVLAWLTLAPVIPTHGGTPRTRTPGSILNSATADSAALADSIRADSLAAEQDIRRAFAADSAASAAFAVNPDSLRALDALALAALADTARVRYEAGAGLDFTNEQFYEDLFDSSLVAQRIGQQRVSTPETRTAALFDAAFAGTRDGRRARYELRPSASFGDLLQRAGFDGVWRQRFGVWNELVLAPGAEFRHDETFGRDLEESRAGMSARLLRTLSDAATVAEGGMGGEWLHARGAGAEYLPSRNSGFVSAALERGALGGPDWRAEYVFRVRTFPDSVERNHLEHGWDARWRRELGGGWALAFDGDGERRGTLRPAPTTRDNFLRNRVAAELSREPFTGWRLRARGEVEEMRYDTEDTTLFENDTATRAWLLFGGSPRSGNWSLSAGPRAELESSDDPVESYRELAGRVELEWLRPGTWWTWTPEAGRRRYDLRASAASDAVNALHSSYTFVELGLIGDQRLAGAMRLRAFATGRLERHDDPSQDSRSLYISCELRRLF